MFKPERVTSILASDYISTEPTELCLLMRAEGSDKSMGWHNYTTLYHALFESIKNEKLAIFEMGLGTTNPNIQSHMAKRYTPCGSLHAWSKYFKNAKVYGGDIDSDILITTDRINTYYVDQTNPESIKGMLSLIDNSVELDIIIDDGLHRSDACSTFLLNSIHRLKKGGIYIIEDVNCNMEAWFKTVNLVKDIGLRYCSLVDLPNPQNKCDNKVIICIK